MCGKMSQRKLGINEKMALFLPIDWCALGKFSVLLLQKWHMFSDESLKIQLSISPHVNADIYMCVYIHIHIYTHTHMCTFTCIYEYISDAVPPCNMDPRISKQCLRERKAEILKVTRSLIPQGQLEPREGTTTAEWQPGWTSTPQPLALAQCAFTKHTCCLTISADT